MTTSFRLALFACALTLASTGCSSTPPLHDETIELAGDDAGKTDSINGKRLELRVTSSAVGPAFVAPASNDYDVVLDAADKIVVSGTEFRWESDGSPNGQWPLDRILSLSAEDPTAAIRLGFVLYAYTTYLLEDGTHPQLEYTRIVCGGTNYFSSVDIDPSMREITIDGTHTFSFTECRVPADVGQAATETGYFTKLFGFAQVVVPVSAPGAFAGTHSFVLHGDVH